MAAQSSVTSAISTRSMNFMRFSQAASAIGVSVSSQVVSPSSTTPAACSMCPCGLSTSSSVDVRGGRAASSCDVIEFSQLSRSGPVTVTTPR